MEGLGGVFINPALFSFPPVIAKAESEREKKGGGNRTPPRNFQPGIVVQNVLNRGVRMSRLVG